MSDALYTRYIRSTPSGVFGDIKGGWHLIDSEGFYADDTGRVYGGPFATAEDALRAAQRSESEANDE